MQRALTLAKRGLGRVEPNPLVGAVLVRRGRVVAEGYHRRYGGPHAEVEALEDARRRGVRSSGCDLYVTLEPCCHRGKTPPCVDAVIQAGIRRVVAAMEDANPVVCGKGVKRLRRVGVEVEVGLCRPQARLLNEPYLKRIKTGLPWMIGKWAQSVDGRIATRSGDSRWISNESSRRVVHRLRARVDAVMVGIGTALKDDPKLDARGVVIKRMARKVVVDPRLRLPINARLLKPQREDGQWPAVTLAVGEQLVKRQKKRVAPWEQRGVEVIGLPPVSPGSSRLDLTVLMRHLVDTHQATTVLVEGGGKLMGSLMQQNLLDQALVFVAPKLIADPAAVAAVDRGGLEDLRHAAEMRLHNHKRIGDDVLFDYRFKTASQNLIG